MINMLNEVSIPKGEWWIYSNGSAHYADGDIGDMGHVAYVTEHVIDEICEFLNIEPDNYLTDETILSIITDPEEKENILENGSYEYVYNKLLSDKFYSSEEQLTVALKIAYGCDAAKDDPRDYAMKYLKWKRVDSFLNEFYIQTWTLTTSDFKNIKDGIDDIIGQDGEEYTEEDEKNIFINIEIRSNNKYFKKIPYSKLASIYNNLSIITQYKNSLLMESVLFQKEGWMLYERDNIIEIRFDDNTKLRLDIKYKPNMDEEQRFRWKRQAASKWKTLAHKKFNSDELSEVGNRIKYTWKECFEEAMKSETLKKYLPRSINIFSEKEKNVAPRIDPVNFTSF